MAQLSQYGTEQVGISTEIAIADLLNIGIAPAYRARGVPLLINHITPALPPILSRIPKPVQHVAAGGNPIDFLCSGDKTLSIKSNMQKAGKVAPQVIGQPTSTTFWSHLPQLVPDNIIVNQLSYQQSANLFKQIVLSNPAVLMTEYWSNLFDCDYLIHVSEVLDKKNNLTDSPVVKLYVKTQSPIWDGSKFSFTKNLTNWNESCTIKYGGISIGEFQVHTNRDCFKFRFILNGLIQANLLH